MVTSVTSFGRSGLSDWLLQRVSAVVLAAYTLFLAGYFLLNQDLTYVDWVALHQCLPMRLFSLLAVLSVAAHAWIGLWSVLTDYVTVRLLGPKATPLRIVLQLGMITVTLAYVAWAVDILWGI
jgi:succinate dehydrogenase / fumarate reductase membrane anchor subunit